jgi:hypothetical protein
MYELCGTLNLIGNTKLKAVPVFERHITEGNKESMGETLLTLNLNTGHPHYSRFIPRQKASGMHLLRLLLGGSGIRSGCADEKKYPCPCR